MPIQTNVVANYQTAEYGKFVQVTSSQFPAVSVTRTQYPDRSEAFPENSTASPVSSVEIYPKFAILTQDIAFQSGASFFTGNSVLSTGSWSAISILADSTFDGLTATNWVGPAVTSSMTFKAGTVIYGAFTGIDLNAGFCLAYNS
jgi:hypothetical protein